MIRRHLTMFFWSVNCVTALLSAGCVNVVTDASSTTNATHQTTINQTQTVVSGGSASSSGRKFDVKAVIEEMGDTVPLDCGKSPDVGVWVVCKVDIPASDNVPKQELISRSAILAKREISEWMGTETSSAAVRQSSREEKNGDVQLEDSLKSEIRTNAKTFLRGVTLYSQKTTPEGFTAYYYVTGKISDRSAELEAQLKAAPPGVVRASGFGTIVNEQVPKAKQLAVQSALQNAVEQVMGTTVIGQSQLMDNDKAKSKLISQTLGNVKQYRVVKEGRDGISYQVIINAQVDEKSLLDNYASMVRSMGNPPFIIETNDPDLKTALTDFFVELGFLVTEKKSDAQFVVKADCTYHDVHDDHYGKGIQINVALNLFDVKTMQQLISMRNQPRLTSTYSGDFHQIRQTAAKRAFKSMKKDLHAKLNKLVMDWVLNGREVQVVFNNVPAELSDEVFVKMIPHIPCATFRTKAKNGSQLILSCSYIGTSGDFEEFLVARMKKDFPAGAVVPRTTVVELNKIEFSF